MYTVDIFFAGSRTVKMQHAFACARQMGCVFLFNLLSFSLAFEAGISSFAMNGSSLRSPLPSSLPLEAPSRYRRPSFLEKDAAVVAAIAAPSSRLSSLAVTEDASSDVRRRTLDVHYTVCGGMFNCHWQLVGAMAMLLRASGALPHIGFRLVLPRMERSHYTFDWQPFGSFYDIEHLRHARQFRHLAFVEQEDGHSQKGKLLWAAEVMCPFKLRIDSPTKPHFSTAFVEMLRNGWMHYCIAACMCMATPTRPSPPRPCAFGSSSFAASWKRSTAPCHAACASAHSTTDWPAKRA